MDSSSSLYSGLTSQGYGIVFKNKLPFILIRISNKLVHALLDTGAAYSCIRKGYYDSLYDPTPIIRYIGVPFKVASNESIVPLGTVGLDLNLGNNNRKRHEFVVFDRLSQNVILGMDFLLQVSGILSFQNTKFNGLQSLVPMDTMENQRILDLLKTFPDVFTSKVGCTDKLEFEIELTDPTPCKQKTYQLPLIKKTEVQKQVDELLALDIIEYSDSSWSSNPLVVPKKTGDWRVAIDYRKLNSQTKTFAFPMPTIRSLLDKLLGCKYLSTIDLLKGFHQIPIKKEHRQYTAFSFDNQLYQYKRISFGLVNAPARFQQLMAKVLKGLIGKFCFVYMDDILVFSKSFDDHIDHIRQVSERLRDAKLTCRVDKCSFGKTKVKYLGYIISEKGIQKDPKKESAVREFPVPNNTKKLAQFLGLASWYRDFCPNLSTIAEPLQRLQRKGVKWEWTEQCQKSFEAVKSLLLSDTVLAFPDFNRRFTLATDASDFGLGAVLYQHDDNGNKKVISYASCTLNESQRNYHAMERECLAVLWATDRFREYLEGVKFTLLTDNKSLTWLFRLKDKNKKMCRWISSLSDFNYDIFHTPGKNNACADALSRNPLPELCVDNFYIENKTPEILNISPESFNISIFKSHQNEDTFITKIKKSGNSLAQPYRIRDGILERDISTTHDTSLWRPVVPSSLTRYVLEQLHDSPWSAHQGIEKTYFNIKQRFWWPGLKRDVELYVQSCVKCQQYKVNRCKPPGQMQSYNVPHPGHTLSIDLVGPLPTSGNQHTALLMTVDTFSKWVELFPLRAATADRICRELEKNVFSRFGAPKVIVTDNGPQFDHNKEFMAMCSRWNIFHKLVSPYKPQGNMVERYNQSIETMIRMFVDGAHTKWDEHLHHFALALRSCINNGTGFSPAKLHLGREIRLPIDNALNSSFLDSEPVTYDNYVDHFTSNLKSIMRKASSAIQANQQKQRHYYNLKHSSLTYSVGQLVWLKTHYLSDKTKKFSKKLAPLYKGPYKISNKLSDLTYELVTVPEGIPAGRQHIGNLKLYVPRHDICIQHQPFPNTSVVDPIVPVPRRTTRVVKRPDFYGVT